MPTTVSKSNNKSANKTFNAKIKKSEKRYTPTKQKFRWFSHTDSDGRYTPGILNSLSDIPWTTKKLLQYAIPSAEEAIESLKKKYIDVPLSKLLGKKPTATIKTNKDFGNRYLRTLNDIALSRLEQEVPNWRKKLKTENDTVKVWVPGNYYTGYKYGNSRAPMFKRLFDPKGQIETTLGDFGVKATKNSIIIDDTYDFNQGQDGNYSNNVYGTMRKWMGKNGPKDTEPDNEKIQTHIVFKRNPKKK